MQRKINYQHDRHCNFISRWIRQSISCSIHEQACLWHFDSGNPFNHFCNARHLEAIFCCWNKIMFHWLANLNGVTWFYCNILNIIMHTTYYLTKPEVFWIFKIAPIVPASSFVHIYRNDLRSQKVYVDYR